MTDPARYCVPFTFHPCSHLRVGSDIHISDLRRSSLDLPVIGRQIELIPQYKSESGVAMEASGRGLIYEPPQLPAMFDHP